VKALDKRLRKAEKTVRDAYRTEMGKCWKEAIEAAGAKDKYNALMEKIRAAKAGGVVIPAFYMPGANVNGRTLAWLIRTDPEARSLFDQLFSIQWGYFESTGGIHAKREKA